MKLSGVLCYGRPLRLKGKFYRSVVRVVKLCGKETVEVKMEKHKIDVTEMWMLFQRFGMTCKNIARKVTYRER